MSTAWNNAMVLVDDELVFTKLNTLMTVAKDATDKVIEATSRAEGNEQNKKLKGIKHVLQYTLPRAPRRNVKGNKDK